jgi:uncharacterized protein DUF1549/uncharacterized protein DUF1553/cytochrome c
MRRSPWLIGVLFSLMLLPASAGRLSDVRLEAESTTSARQAAPTKPAVPPPVAKPPGQAEAARRPRIDFEQQIKPILDKKCSECHSAEKRKGGLSLATYGDALDGGRNGAAIRPGASTRSIMVQRLLGRIEPQMPKDEDPLPASEISLIRRWIDEGARETASSAPAPQPWEAPLGLTRPAVPPATWSAWSTSIDRFVASDMSKRQATEPSVISDALFARRAYLDVWGLLPPPEALQEFLKDDGADKRDRLVETLLADNQRYAEHWISFWNDLLRNEDGVTYYSETASRKSITTWLRAALESNLGYDRFVAKLLSPTTPGDPDGFLVGVNWRGETSAAVMPWMQASQNSAQIFLGVNLKCNACHDSFVSHWKLKDAYSLASYFSPDAKLQLFRCDRALDQYAEPRFLYPELNRVPSSASLDARRATVAKIFTDARNGRLARTLVNRVWLRLFGYGIVANPDEMDGKPWDPALLDWIAADFVDHGYDIKHLIQTIMTSRAYQLPAVARTGEPPLPRNYRFDGPEVRRLSAEQFADAIGEITGEWGVRQQEEGAGTYAREWRAAATNLTRALGRPIRDQVTSVRVSGSTTLQELELVNGAILTARLSRGARRLLGELAPAPASAFSKSVAGRSASTGSFDLDVSKVSKLWLILEDDGSSAPERNQAAWADVELIGSDGASTPLESLKPAETSGLRTGAGPIALAAAKPPSKGRGIRVQTPSRLVYDIAGQGFTRFRGTVGIENTDVGATLQPQIRFFVFDAEPDMERLVPPTADSQLPAPAPLSSAASIVDRIFWYALSRAPSADERAVAEDAVKDPAHDGRLAASGVADLLWAVLMKPEFQLIY